LASSTEFPNGLVILNSLSTNDGRVCSLEIFANKPGFIILGVSFYDFI
jgi:hypothetical protein